MANIGCFCNPLSYNHTNSNSNDTMSLPIVLKYNHRKSADLKTTGEVQKNREVPAPEGHV